MNVDKYSLLGVVAFITLAASSPAVALNPAWEAKVMRLVSENYSYPRSAELRGEQGRAVVKITISAAGKPVSVELVQSTGSPILDREAVRIPMRVTTFPTPPDGTSKVVVVPIRWQIS